MGITIKSGGKGRDTGTFGNSNSGGSYDFGPTVAGSVNLSKEDINVTVGAKAGNIFGGEVEHTRMGGFYDSPVTSTTIKAYLGVTVAVEITQTETAGRTVTVETGAGAIWGRSISTGIGKVGATAEVSVVAEVNSDGTGFLGVKGELDGGTLTVDGNLSMHLGISGPLDASTYPTTAGDPYGLGLDKYHGPLSLYQHEIDYGYDPRGSGTNWGYNSGASNSDGNNGSDGYQGGPYDGSSDSVSPNEPSDVHGQQSVSQSTGGKSGTANSTAGLNDGEVGVGTDNSGVGDQGLGSGWGGLPVILDLDGDGVEITFGQNVYFDFDEDGFLEQTSWAAADDGFLVIDLNADGTRGGGDGVIDQARELAFSLWGEDGMTDLQALAQATDDDGNLVFDSNGDGVLDAQDDVWDELRVWQDHDQDGETDQGELYVLSGVIAHAWYDLNGDQIETADEIFQLEEVQTSQQLDDGTVTNNGTITSVNLTYDDGGEFGDEANAITVFGNTLFGLASFTAVDEDGVETTVEGGVGDVALAYNAQGWRRVETALGYSIEFETGAQYHYAELDADTVADVDLNTLNLDGAVGDDRDNVLDATGHLRSVGVSGGEGNDSIIGGHSDDLISGDAGVDTLKGGQGNDQIFFDADDAIVWGGNGYDTAIATTEVAVSVNMVAQGFEQAFGNDGDDVFDGSGAQVDLALHGADGDDLLTGGDANDVLSGDNGNDTLNAGKGDDFVSGGAGDDSIDASNGDDVVFAGDGDDVAHGGAGDDDLYLSDGDDAGSGGAGDDFIDGGDGADTLSGNAGDDTLLGGDGDDVLTGGDGDDRMEGGDGDDIFRVTSTPGENAREVILGGAGDDRLELSGLESDWVWEYVHHAYVPVSDDGDESSPPDIPNLHESGGGPGGDPDNETPDDLSSNDTPQFVSVGQYRLTNGTTYIDVMDVETLVFTGSNTSVTLDHVSVDLDNSDTFARTNHNSIYAYVMSSALWQGSNADDSFVDSLDYYVGGNAGEWRTQAYGVGSDTYDGSSGNDNMAGGTGDDTMSGGAGHDNLDGAGGNDLIDGGDGSDNISGGIDNDTITGGNGSDTLNGGNNNDSLTGNAGSDVLLGEHGDDMLKGGDGADVLAGGDGSDTLYGQSGADRLYGGRGTDSLSGGNSNDSLYGGDGEDTLKGGYGNDLLAGGIGDDTLMGEQGQDVLYGEAGVDHLDGGDDDDALFGGADDDVLLGGMGADYLEGGAGADALDGGNSALDVAGYRGSDARVIVNLLTGEASGGDAAGDTFTGIEGLLGSQHNDRLTGNNLANQLIGLDGNDRLTGNDGRDTLDGGDGDDTLSGNLDADTINGGDGDDLIIAGYGGEGQQLLSGGNGSDTYQIHSLGLDHFVHEESENGSHDVVTFQNLNWDDITVTTEDDVLILSWTKHDGGSVKLNDLGANIEEFIFADGTSVTGFEGSNANDILIANDAGSEFHGGHGSDSITGDAGDDFLTGGTDNDTLSGADGADTIWGGNGDDAITAGAGNDLVIGGAGNDSLSGEAGNDTLTGGAGADTFMFNANSLFGNDVIKDFEAGSDLIEIAGLGFADLNITSVANGLSIQTSQGDILLEGVNLAPLTQDDFVFV